MTEGTLFSAKTVEEAVAEGLRSLGLQQSQVDIEVVSRGSRGLFGIGSEPAQVRITPRRSAAPAAPATPVAPATPAASTTPAAPPAAPAAPAAPVTPPAAPPVPAQTAETLPQTAPQTAPFQAQERIKPTLSSAGNDVRRSTDEGDAGDGDEDKGSDQQDGEPREEASEEELAALAVELLTETVRLMGFEASISASWQEPDADNDDRYLLLDLEGRDLGALIGRRGETLGNLQYLLRLMVNQRLHQWKNIVVDVEQYRQHRAEHLMQLAQRSAEQVAKSGRPLSLEPMPSNERRIIHLALRDHALVYTESSGEGERRKIQILPRSRTGV
jgi:spoIIIJ-associated protein